MALMRGERRRRRTVRVEESEGRKRVSVYAEKRRDGTEKGVRRETRLGEESE